MPRSLRRSDGGPPVGARRQRTGERAGAARLSALARELLGLEGVSESLGSAALEPRARSTLRALQSLPLFFAFQGAGVLRPSLVVALNADAGLQPPLVGPNATLYRVEPQMMLSILPRTQVQTFLGGGVGAAYVAPALGGGWVSFAMSGTIGAAVAGRHGGLRAAAWAETIGGRSVLVTLTLGFWLR